MERLVVKAVKASLKGKIDHFSISERKSNSFLIVGPFESNLVINVEEIKIVK